MAIDKLTTFTVINSKIMDSDTFSLEKVASEKELPEEFDPDFLYVWVRSISAGEYWSSNKNADFFSEKELLESHHTFLEAHVFKNHDNKDVAKAIGSVLKTVWNNDMKCVELLLKIDRVLAPEIVRAFEKGYSTDVSMGCRVKQTVCSICGNVAKVRPDFCEHVKTQRNQVLPDGRKVFEYNIGPRFHDISVVLNGADRTAKVLEFVGPENMPKLTVPTVHKFASKSMKDGLDKAASYEEPSTETTDNIFNMRKSATEKLADIQKEVVDKFYTLALLRRLDEHIPEDINENDLVHSLEELNYDKLAFGISDEIEKVAYLNPKDLSRMAIGATGIALATNYYQGKRLRGEHTNKVENFVADNPGVLPLAFLGAYPLAKGMHRKIKLKRHPEFTAYASTDNYKDFLEKTSIEDNITFKLASNDELLNPYRSRMVAEKFKKEYDVDDNKLRFIKAATILYGASKDSFNNVVTKHSISDSEINGFIKTALSCVEEELDKVAESFMSSYAIANTLNSTKPRGLNTGFGGVGLAAALVDAVILKKFFSTEA